MTRKSAILVLSLTALFLSIGLMILNSPSEDPRKEYEEELIAMFKQIPDDIGEEAEGENRPDRPDLAAMQNFFSTMDPELKAVPAERLSAAWDATRELKKSTLKQGIPMLFWETAGSNMGGRTRAIMYDPNDASGNKVWAGAVTGGIWYNNDITNDQSDWMPVNDFLSNLSISCIVYDPNDPMTFYAGTGEAETARVIYRESSGVGMGILKSTDGGASWDLIPSSESFKYVTDIQIRDEDGTSVIYAGVASGVYKGITHNSQPSNGLFRSVDAGNSWTQVIPNIPGTDEPYAISDIKIQGDGRIYVGSMGNPDLEGGATIFYSDQGTAGTWTVYDEVKNQIENQTSHNIPGRVILVPSPSEDYIVYALFSVGNNEDFVRYRGRLIYRTVDSGETWDEVNIPDIQYATLSWHALCGAINPADPNHIFVGGLDAWSSSNAGNSWNQKSDWWWMYYGGDDRYVHADQHIHLYKPGSSEEMLMGTDGGIFYTSNATSFNPVFVEKNHNYGSLQFYTCAISPIAGDDRYIGGLQDNGTLYYQGDPLDINDMIDQGDGAGCFWDADEPEIFITSVYYNRYTVWDNGVPEDAGEESGTFICPADYDYKLNTLYANACGFQGQDANELLVIRNIPDNPWHMYVNLGTGLSTYYTHIKYSPHSPDGTTTLFVGSQTGQVFKVESAQASPAVTEITGPEFPEASVSCVAIGGSEDTLMVTFSNYGVNSVWQTYDGGDTWASIESNLPDMPIRWAIYHPHDAKQAMLATEIGTWTCNHLHLDDPQWIPNVEGMANVRVDMLQIREADNTVLAATHGRGLYTAEWVSNPWVSIGEQPELPVSAIYPNPVRDVLNIRLDEQINARVSLDIFDMQGRLVMREELDGMISDHIVNTGQLPAGSYVVRMHSGKRSYSESIIHQ
ncbi:MAG: T9SS type A sorting domain-containing protein [Bacteroidales bacterium]|jgi:photosystem II stability/assembly factor-like uncharacterized protein|nr:T9SS type A sorting domain-containing protein [Bacteroidales bacterium]